MTIRSFWVCGALLVAILANTAWAAGARAAEPEFHCTASTVNCFITGSSSDNVLRLESGNKLSCTTTQFSATAAKTAATVNFAPTYSSCKFAGVKATVTSEGCVFSVHLVEEGTTPYPATTGVICPEGKKFTITASTLPCTVTIGTQSGLSGLSLEDVESTHVKGTLALKGIAYTATGVGCGAEGSGTNGEYTGTMPLNGYEDLSGSEGSAAWLHILKEPEQEPEFHCTASTVNCFITGSSSDNVLRLESGNKLSCTTTQFSATAAKPQSTDSPSRIGEKPSATV